MSKENYEPDMKNIMSEWAGENFVIINRDFARKHGYRNAVVFGNMCSMAKQFNNNFYYLIENIAKQSFMCKQYVREAIKYLQEKQFIRLERKGIPSKVFYSVNLNKIQEMNKKIIKEIEKEKEEMLGLAITYDSTASINMECDSYIYNNNNTNNKEEIVTQSYYSSNNNLNVTITPSSEGDTMTSYEGLVKEEKKTLQPKKKPTIMSTASYKLIEKLILDTDLFFNHRLPTEKNDYKITNTIKRAVEYIDYLSAGLFMKKLPFSDDYLKQYEGEVIIPNKPLIFSEVNDIIMYAIDNWKLYLTIGYMPENKEGLKKVSIDNWLYNVHTGFSWFLECLNKPAKEIKRYTANQLLDQVPEEFADKFLGLYKSIQMDDDEKSQFYRYIYYLYKRWESITEWYDGFLTRSGYRNYIGHPAVFAQTLKTFLTYYTHWENWRHLKPNSAMWRDFRKHCLKEYNVDINPNKDWLDKAIIEEKEDAERTAMARKNEELKLRAEKERADRLELERMFG